MTDPALAQKTPKGRFYRHPRDGSMAPSITNIKDMKALKGLPAWAARECGQYAADNIANLANLPPDDIVQLVKGAPFRYNSSKGTSALVGDIVHDWIDQDTKGETVDTSYYVDREGERKKSPQQARWMWNSYQTVKEYYSPNWIMSEFTVWNYEYGYAGTADLAGYIKGGSDLTLVDTKTGKNVYPDMAIQLAAIAHADCIVAPDGTETPLPPFKRFAIMHIRPRMAELVPVDHIEEWWHAFLGLKMVFDTVNQCEESTLLYTPKLQVRVSS